ncbi:receptor-activated Ca2+-permeable cation channel [Sporothrix brasiliensis 5110]|uniref:Receptor-activated Ca2+-permeable cation channel n=1 Tax=Sporothrix brasiliensis 5110 TaxID=1398154 RepID=A0A0C2IRW2_9PEZI|nr:receptor-activated Ca2+-permeable cation channel [Sporothrix brasiliensis 5110]KIH89615.1 receptor-activated Ca2+-permeable cation channel [Sporothrix brasiliensis 5110]
MASGTSTGTAVGSGSRSGSGTGSGPPPPRSPNMAARTPRPARTPPPASSHGRSRSGTATSTASYATNTDHDERQPLLHPMRRTFNHDLEPDPIYSCTTNPHTHLPVYTNIHRIRRDIVSVVEDYLSPEQLHDMRINLSVVRPLVDKLYELDDISIVYCLLVNRARFLHEQAHLSNRQNVNFTRATLCELIAHRILRRFNEDNEGLEGLLVLSHILVAGFEPFQNAPDTVRPSYAEDAADPAGHDAAWLYRRSLPALEVAILSEAKLFLSSTACQKVIEAIYVGRVTYTPSSLLNLIPDRYKQKPIALYDPRGASLLNQYRLIVPRTRNILESLQFTTLLVLYLCFMAERDAARYSGLELAFSIFSFGWVLDQFATILEHGWHVYTQNLWSFLDVAYAVVYWVYLLLRIQGFRTGNAPGGAGQQALDVMALAAPVLIPRIAFTVLSDNLLFVSLRSMVADFTLLTFLAAWCFAGFLLSLSWLGEGRFSVVMIGKWMVYIWFGLDGTGIHRSTEFHWLLGPSLMVAFAFLGNTLFLTILVSMLSNTFSTIVSNATAEIQYRRAVLTLEGVKSDAIFAYQPPFNILALFVLVPLKFLVSPRWFHKIHVACVRSINLPILLVIAVAERRLLWPSSPYSKHYSAYRSTEAGLNRPPTSTRGRLTAHPTSPEYAAARARAARDSFWGRWRITAHSDIQAVFDMPPPDSVEEEIAADDDLTRHLIRRQFTRQQTTDAVPTLAKQQAQSQQEQQTQARPGQTQHGASTEARPASNAGSTGPGGLQRSGSTVKFAEAQTAQPQPAASQGGARTPRPPKATGTSRRDSIAFPGLDPDKLKRLLQLEAEENGHGNDSAPTTAVDEDVRTRLDGLEASMQRIEGMLAQLLGTSSRAPSGAPSVRGGPKGTNGDDADENAVEDGDDMEGEDVDEEAVDAAHEAADEVIDEDEAVLAEHTGTMTDLDETADER